MRTIEGKKLTFRKMAASSLATGLLALGAFGCKGRNTVAPIIVGPDGGDPAAANVAPPYTGGGAGGYSVAGEPSTGSTGRRPTRVLGFGQSFAGQTNGKANGQGDSEADGGVPGEPGAAPIVRGAAAGMGPNAGQGVYDQGNYAVVDYAGDYDEAERGGEQAIADTEQAPPLLPVYDQPPAPEADYLWTPGYWNFASAGYYWVPGAWVAPPFYGALWTPPWWALYRGRYRLHRGYWGSHVGFYGGIDYGFGYIGTGYYGGYWRGHDFYYNRAVTNVNVGKVRNVYDRPVVYGNRTYGPRSGNRVDFNGGRGGIEARPTPSEVAALHEAHYAAVPAQRDNRTEAAADRGQFAGAEGGRPAVAFASRPMGTRESIAEIPREQPINRPPMPGVFGRMAVARTGEAVRAGGAAESSNGVGRARSRAPGQDVAGNAAGSLTGNAAGNAAVQTLAAGRPRPEAVSAGNAAPAEAQRPAFANRDGNEEPRQPVVQSWQRVQRSTVEPGVQTWQRVQRSTVEPGVQSPQRSHRNAVEPGFPTDRAVKGGEPTRELESNPGRGAIFVQPAPGGRGGVAVQRQGPSPERSVATDGRGTPFLRSESPMGRQATPPGRSAPPAFQPQPVAAGRAEAASAQRGVPMAAAAASTASAPAPAAHASPAAPQGWRGNGGGEHGGHH